MAAKLRIKRENSNGTFYECADTFYRFTQTRGHANKEKTECVQWHHIINAFTGTL